MIKILSYKLWCILINFIFVIIFTPLFLIVSIIIYILNFFYNKGPLFFIQNRLGLNGITFKLYKFRTMYVDAEKDGPQWASLDDTRITKLGRFLRISRIDELPQIINIIKGNINLIGPRAERPEMRDIIIKHIPNFNDRLLIKPGITGLAQISSGYSNNIDQMITKLEEDILYIRSKSILLDLKIIYKTIFIILKLLGT